MTQIALKTLYNLEIDGIPNTVRRWCISDPIGMLTLQRETQCLLTPIGPTKTSAVKKWQGVAGFEQCQICSIVGDFRKRANCFKNFVTFRDRRDTEYRWMLVYKRSIMTC